MLFLAYLFYQKYVQAGKYILVYLSEMENRRDLISTATFKGLDAGGNRWRFRDAQIDAWVEAGQRSEDRETRRGLYAKVERRLISFMA